MRTITHGIERILASLLYIVFGTVLVCALFAAATAAHVWYFARSDDRAPADTIFVLGAAQYDGVPSNWPPGSTTRQTSTTRAWRPPL